jgi:hypothetical protein
MYCRTKFPVLFFMASIVIACFCANAQADVLIKPGVYIIQMSNSSMTVACSSDAEHSPLILWPTRPTANWNFETTGNGYYSLDSNQYVLDGGNGAKGTPITMKRQDKDWLKTMWKIVKVGQYYKFINAKTGKAMTLTNGQRTRGSKIGNAPVADTMDQLFCIQKAETIGYCGEGSPNTDYSVKQDTIDGQRSDGNRNGRQQPSRKPSEDKNTFMNK